MVYNIRIQETVVGDFQVEAISRNEAIEIASRKYYNCEFVNEPGKLIDKKISASLNNEDIDVWEEL